MIFRVATCCVLAVIVFLLGGPAYAADRISVSVPKITAISQDESSVIEPYELFLRSAASPGILNKKSFVENGKDKFRFVKAVELNRDENWVRFDIKNEIEFVTGKPLRARDVEWSLNRCQKSGEYVPKLRTESDRSTYSSLSFVLEGDVDQTLTFIENCSILEESSSRIFGSYLGKQNLFVGLGPYSVIEFFPGRRITLKKTSSLYSNKGAESLEVRQIPDGDKALTALRYGSVDLVFTENDNALKSASSDSTLEIGDCKGFSIIHRKGLVVDCDLNDWGSRLRYRG